MARFHFLVAVVGMAMLCSLAQAQARSPITTQNLYYENSATGHENAMQIPAESIPGEIGS